MNCEFCKKKITKRIRRNKSHMLTLKSFTTIIFCSIDCKKKWVSFARDKQKGTIIVWALGEYLDSNYFIKKLVKVNGANSTFSHFSCNLTNLEKLELIEKENIRFLRVSKAKT